MIEHLYTDFAIGFKNKLLLGEKETNLCLIVAESEDYEVNAATKWLHS